jgi:hypothetical protein
MRVTCACAAARPSSRVDVLGACSRARRDQEQHAAIGKHDQFKSINESDRGPPTGMEKVCIRSKGGTDSQTWSGGMCSRSYCAASSAVHIGLVTCKKSTEISLCTESNNQGGRHTKRRSGCAPGSTFFDSRRLESFSGLLRTIQRLVNSCPQLIVTRNSAQ